MRTAAHPVEQRRTLEVTDPQDGSLIESIPMATAEEMLEAIERAKEGARVAGEMPTHERARVLRKAAELVEARLERFAATISREGSKTIREARAEARRCVETLRISSEEARRLHGETIPFDQMPGSEDRVGYFYRFPIGLIGAITPFNDPLNLVAHKVGPAIAAGNAIVVKPATVTPLSALMLEGGLAEAGLPSGVLSVVVGDGREVGDPLVTHPDVRMISFTGGLETGEAISRKAGLKRLQMELGSNSPVIVLSDADLSEAVEATAAGAFSAAGQNCLGVQRVFVEEPHFQPFAEALAERASRMRTGDKRSEETDVGPMITEGEATRVEEWVNEAVRDGARVLTGGTRDGAFYQPTVLTGVPADGRLAREEVFGPVVSVYAVSDLDAAVDAANAVDYGLQAGIFTKNVEDAFRAIQKLEVGGVMVNDSSDYRVDAMPFGGVKGSGLGREGVAFAIEQMTETKVVAFRFSKRL